MQRLIHAVPRRFSALLLTAAILAAGCSSDDDGQDGASSATTAAAESIDPDGVVRVGYDIRPESGGGWFFDPTEAQSTVHQGWYHLMYGGLLRPVLDGPPEPGLAESTTITDANTIEITLREGLTFSDGTPFDAEAVKAGLERNLAEGTEAIFTPAFFDLETVEVTSPTTLALTISDGKAAGWHDEFLAGFQTSITKPGQTDFSDGTIGAGPFTVTSYEPDQSVTFAKSETYWDADAVTLGGIEIVQVPHDQPQVATAALQSGQIDMAQTTVAQLEALTGRLELFTQPDPNQTVGMFMCKDEAPLDDERARLAINKAVDRETLGEAVYAGTTEPAGGLWPEGHRFHNPELDGVLAYDPAEARSLLTEAGYGDGFDVDLYVVSGVGIPESAEVIEQQLAEVGIDTNIIIPANFVSEYLDPPQPGVALYPGNAAGRAKLNSYSGDSLGNVCNWDDPELNSLVAELATVSDSSDEAVELWHEIEAKVVNEALGGFFLFRSRLAAYDTERLGSMALFPLGSVVVPDPRSTWVSAGS